MSANTSYRLSGVALLIGSALSIVYLLIQGWFLPGNSLATITSQLDVISNEIGIVGGILVLLGLPGMYVRQADRAGVLGLLGFLFVWYVSLIQSVILPFANITVISQMTAHIIPSSAATAMTAPPVWGPFFTLSMVSEVLGILLLAIAILRARVFPRWIGWTLIATLVIGVLSFVPFVPEAVSNLTAIAAALAVGGIGYALLSPARGASAETAPASVRATVGA